MAKQPTEMLTHDQIWDAMDRLAARSATAHRALGAGGARALHELASGGAGAAARDAAAGAV